MTEVRPRVYISRCLGYEHCRFDGAIIKSRPVEKLKDHADVIHDCPEMGIGLGVPRRPINIKMGDKGRILHQPATGRDLTEEMNEWVRNRLDSLGEVHGFILKSKSPSCGIGDVKLYRPEGIGVLTGKDDGFFGRGVKERFSHLAVETEARLGEETILDHFLTKLFTLARFSEARKNGKARDLIDFHSRHKFLLMAYSQKELKTLGNITASQKERGIDDAWDQYGTHLSGAMSKGAKYSSQINVLSHMFGYFSGDLENRERHFFLDLLEAYREDRIPLSACKEVLRGMIIRFDVEYLKDQLYLDPYPVELTPEYETKRNRDLWK
ncbi:MAG: YbgA family protein [Thermoplasmatota archaeon]